MKGYLFVLGVVVIALALVAVFNLDGSGEEEPGREPADEKTVTRPASAPEAPAPTSDLPEARAADVGGGPVAGKDSVPGVVPDPDYATELRVAGISTRGWETDFSRHTIPYAEIFSGGVGRDGIPPIDDPTYASIENANGWLDDQEPVIALEIDGDARAFPLQVMTWHEIVNDVVGGTPVTVTFCPLCNSGIAFDRRLDGTVYDFGVSGKLRNSDLIMWDRQTESWWQQFTGEGIVGELAGKMLAFLPSSIVSYADFKSANPEGLVLSRETGFSRPYGRNPYAGYDQADSHPFLFDGDTDGRLLPKERVVAVSLGDRDLAFPYSLLAEEGAVNYGSADHDLVVFFKSGTTSALDRNSIKDSRDVGATGVFDPHVDGRKLTFRADGDNLVDNETGTVWNILGHAVEGPLAGNSLTPIVHGDHFWFAWGAFNPDTVIYQGAMG